MPASTSRAAARPQSASQGHRSRRRRRRPSPTGQLTRWLIGFFAAMLLAAALGLAWLHPSGPVLAIAAVLLLTLAARYFWTVWPGWMLGLVPWIGLAPWTGMTLVEEFDLLVLASLAGGYLAISGPHRHPPPQAVPVWRRELRWRRLTVALLAMAGASAALAVVHGLVDGGGLQTDLYQGHLQTGAVVRAGKPFLWVLLLLPLWQRVSRRTPHTLGPSVMAGMTLGLLGVIVGALLERLQFGGLLGWEEGIWLSGFFWEMQVGGGALEGAMALLMPFGLLLALHRRQAPGFALAVALLLAGAYVVLCTASRPLMLSLGLSLPLAFTLWVHQQRRRERGARDPASSWLPGLVAGEAPAPALPPGQALTVVGLLLLLAGWVAWSLWPYGAYRGGLAVAAATMVLLAQPAAFARSHRARAMSFGLGLVLVALPLLGAATLLAMAVQKSAYASFALFWAASMGLAFLAGKQRSPWFSGLGDALRAGLWLATAGGIGLVLWGWGGMAALEPTLLPLLLLAAVWPLSQGGWYGGQLRQLGWRTRLVAMGAAVLLVGAVGLMAQSTGWLAAGKPQPVGTLAERLHHWQRTLSIIDGESGWVLGAGAGRFPQLFNVYTVPQDRGGNYRWVDGTKASLRLTTGAAPAQPGDMLRMTQRIGAAPADLQLVLKARNDEDVQLHVEVCNKHLLSGGPCVKQEVTLRANPDGWREHRIALGGQGELSGSLQFAVALAGRNDSALLSDLSLKGSDGVELLRNGDFQQGLRHWLMSSERLHTPWHARHIALHQLFEQGALGLLLGGGLWLLALGRLLIGTARDHPLAPALAPALIGFVVMGQFESLIDVPRLALLFFVCVALGLGLRAPPPPPIPKPAGS